MKIVRVSKGRGPHKWRATFPDGRSVNFGLRGYSDYTIHKDQARMKRYLTRHVKRENWSPSGRYKAGFWSRWLLWSKPSLKAAAQRTAQVLGPGWRVSFSK